MLLLIVRGDSDFSKVTKSIEHHPIDRSFYERIESLSIVLDGILTVWYRALRRIDVRHGKYSPEVPD